MKIFLSLLFVCFFTYNFSDNIPKDAPVIWGIAATSHTPHLGSYASLKVLENYAKKDHPVFLLIDDETAGLDPVGSPGKTGPITPEIQKKNAKSIATILKCLFPEATIYYSSELNTEIAFSKLLQVTSNVQVKEGSLADALYPFSDAFTLYDIIQKIHANNVIFVTGEDQKPNFKVTEELLKEHGIQSHIIMHKLLPGPQTEDKMGKRGFNAVNINNPAGIAKYIDDLSDSQLPLVWELLGEGTQPKDAQEVRDSLKTQLKKLDNICK